LLKWDCDLLVVSMGQNLFFNVRLAGNLRQDLIHFMGNNKNESTPCFLDWELRVKMAIELVDKKTKVFNFKKLIGSDEFSSRQVDEQVKITVAFYDT